MGLSRGQDLGDQQELVQWNFVGFIKSVLKIFGHGLIVLIGLNILNIYLGITMENLRQGNYFVFLPPLMALFIPLVLILLGAVNSYSVRYIYKRKTDDTWLRLLLEGIFVSFIGFLFTLIWILLFFYFFGPLWPFPYYLFSPLFIPYSFLLLSSVGYTSKEATFVIVTRTKDLEKKSKFEK
jgi:hypothetical protein